MAKMHLGSVQQVVGLQLRCRGFQHRYGRVDCGEMPLRLQRRHRNDFLRRAASADHQYVGRTRTQARRQHAGRQIMTGVVAGQRDAALAGVFAGAGGVEFFCGAGRGLAHGNAPGFSSTLRRRAREGKFIRFMPRIPCGNAGHVNLGFVLPSKQRLQPTMAVDDQAANQCLIVLGTVRFSKIETGQPTDQCSVLA
ncbi:hypothetical protein D3C78_1130220 [compost metagenome]